jgi:hypothetical protein
MRQRGERKREKSPSLFLQARPWKDISLSNFGRDQGPHFENHCSTSRICTIIGLNYFLILDCWPKLSIQKNLDASGEAFEHPADSITSIIKTQRLHISEFWYKQKKTHPKQILLNRSATTHSSNTDSPRGWKGMFLVSLLGDCPQSRSIWLVPILRTNIDCPFVITTVLKA